MNQTKKALIAAALKQVVPSGWKYSLGVRNHSTIVMNITAAPFNLIAAFKPNAHFNPETSTYMDVNPYHYREQLDDEAVADVMDMIFAALNDGNHDRSDSQTDYFDVGWYVDVNIGRWNKPFVCNAKPLNLKVAA
jgi:hypothetical protein